jgi:serine/threonine protein kinase
MKSRLQQPAVFDDEGFLAGLRASGLLPPETVEALATEPAPRDPRARASELVERGLLTGYQAEQLLAGNAHSLLLGQYRILDALGAGGMGRVYKAEHVLMKRVVALKVVGAAEDPDAPAADERRAAFLREIEAAALLSHPNVVTAYDAGEADGVRFLIMEYVDGVDLERLVRAVGPLPPRRACEYVRQVALALQHAFERGVLHRDVKPANLLTEQASGPRSAGRVKVLDLGLAQGLRAGAGGGGARAASRLSGTPDYIAPEVAHDADSRDVRSDLYSLGCTLYYLLTARVPFPGGTWTEKLLRHQFDAPAPLRELAPRVPAAVAAVVGRLMAKAPADRYDTPAAAARALEEWLALGEDPPAAPAPSRTEEEASADGLATPSPGWGRAACPTVPLNPGPPSAWEVAVPAAAPPRRLPWLPVIALALVAAAGAAWLARAPVEADEVAAPVRPDPAAPFVVERTGAAHATLAAALAGADDGDTVVIHGDGPFATGPVAVAGKALALRAAPGSRPCLRFARPPAAWQALLSSDRPLALEGIDLCHDAPGGEPAHLVCASGASLRLVRCRVTAPRRSAPVVARGASRVELRDCRLLAGSLALCAEAGAGTCEVVLAGNTIEVGDAGAAAVSVWAGGRTGLARVELEANEVRGARVLSLGDLAAGVTVTAGNNRFDVGEALLCVNGCGGPGGWRRVVAWHGRGNRYRGPGDWLRVDGRAAGPRDLEAWQQTWGAEPGSAVVP